MYFGRKRDGVRTATVAVANGSPHEICPWRAARRTRRNYSTMIQAAWLWLKHQPKSAITRWFVQRTAGQSGRIRRIMIIAVARKLAIALWRFLEQGLVPQGAMAAGLIRKCARIFLTALRRPPPPQGTAHVVRVCCLTIQVKHSSNRALGLLQGVAFAQLSDAFLTGNNLLLRAHLRPVS